MPEINPEDYNIDNFNSQNLGPISVIDFRRYVLNYNLSGLDPVLAQNGIQDFGQGVYAPSLFNPNPSVVDLPNLSEVAFLPSPINDNTTPRPDNKQRNIWTNEKPFYGSPTEEETFDVTTKSLEDPGSIDAWVEEAGFSTDVFSVRNFNNLVNNEYGPEFIETYNDPDQPLESTGYAQYPTSSGTDVLGPIIARSLGFSPENFIDFPSELQDVGTERRASELASRIALNFVDDTVGRLNLDPLGLLAGQSLFLPDFTITKPKGFLGKAAQFTASLTGFNFPRSPLPGGDQIRISSNAFQEDLIDFTGRAQRKLLYGNVYSSKYVPELLGKQWDPAVSGKDTALNKIGGFFESLSGKKIADNYLKINKPPEESKPNNLFGKIGQAISDAIVPGDDSLIPLVDKQTNPNDPFVVMGTEGQYPSVKSINEDPNSNFNELELNQPPDTEFGSKDGEYFPNNTTLRPSLLDSDETSTPFTQVTPSTKNNFYWKNRQQSVAKRGLLDFTQKMINNSEAGGHRGGAKFIGRFDSDSNITETTRGISDGAVTNISRNSNVSRGNLVRYSDDSHYCRSWSTRSPYQNHYDLIRRSKLLRAGGKSQPDDIASGPFFGPYQSVLEETGHVKVSPTSGDDYLQDPTLTSGFINKGNDIKRFMFSIENLAWTDASQKIGLDPCEIGPNGGRIMWFPPYDITFTDNTTANWNSETFLGRAEPIYTYNTTERKGTLSWSIITDHPSVLNKLKDRKESELYQFFAGCGLDISEFFETTVEEVIPIKQEPEPPKEDPETPPEPEPVPIPEPRIPKEPPVTELSFYFRNAKTDGKCKGRNCSATVGRTIQQEIDIEYDTGTQNDISKTKKGDYLFLNKEWIENIDALIDFLATPDGQNWCVEFNGYCSAAGTDRYNDLLSIDRVDRVYKDVVGKIKAKGEAGPPPPGGTEAFLLGIEEIATSGATTGNTEYYVYDENNFKRADFGFKCIDGKEDKRTASRKATDKKLGMNSTKCSDCFSIGKQFGYYPYVNFKEITKPGTDEELSKAGRWIVSANSEKYAKDVDEDGDPLESENSDGTVTPVGVNSKTAKEDRVVTLRVFKNHTYINNTEAAKNNAEKLAFINEPVDRLELAPITPLTTPPLVLPPKEIQVPIIGATGNITGTQTLTLGPDGKPIKPLTDEERAEAEALAKVLFQANKAADEVENNDIQTGDGGDIGENVNDEEVKEVPKEEIIRRNVQLLFKECEYFEALKVEDPFVYEGIKEKIRFFQPSFHSITPEGLNSRLTFLHQCMRQGPSLREGTNQTQNMAFGKPPVLVLRIGDFYYTKIIPDSLNINYEPLQWDMNPEGVGVQPMIAKVDLNFSMIGGSSLDGPIRQLQNAVSFNFFANTSVYNPRRYYNPEDIKVDENGNVTTSYQSLEQKLEGDANRILSDNIIGFGAFKNQKTADQDRTNPPPVGELVQTIQDKKDQATGLYIEPIDTSTLFPPESVPDLVGVTSNNPNPNQPDLAAPGQGLVEVEGLDSNASVFSSFGAGGLFGTPADQQMIKDMYAGAKTPDDDIAETKVYGVDYLEITTLPLGDQVLTNTVNTNAVNLSNQQFKSPDGSGGILLDLITFGISNDGRKQGWLVQNKVELKLTYPDGTTKEITDSDYVVPIKVERSSLGEPYTNYNTLNTETIQTESTFEVQKFYTDWFDNLLFSNDDVTENGTYKLDITWTYLREITADTVEEGTEQEAGKITSRTYKESLEYNLFENEYVDTTSIGPTLGP